MENTHTQNNIEEKWLSSGLPESKERFVGVDSELKTSPVVVASEKRESVDMKRGREKVKIKEESKSWRGNLNACKYLTKLDLTVKGSWLKKKIVQLIDRQSHMVNCPKWKLGLKF